jgi:uncharacterized protein YjiS (DUF1127 family)
MTYITATHCSSASRLSLVARISQSYDIWRQRQQLRRLDDAALKDIGISRAQAHFEANRPIWDAPETWTR